MEGMNTNQHLYLTGYRGTGKSAVGAFLAKHFGRTLIDLDQVIQSTAGKTIREIFDIGGESLFRNLESAALAKVSQSAPAIISLGGGTILLEQNRQIIRATGTCVWLVATAQTIAQRIAADTTTAASRPPLTSLDQLTEIQQLMQQRRPMYEAAADYKIDTDEMTIDEVAARVIESLN